MWNSAGRNKVVPETGSTFDRGPHQFRTRNDLIKAQRTRSNSLRPRRSPSRGHLLPNKSVALRVVR